MIIDFHTHIFPPVIRSDRDAYFPAEPAFKLLYDSPKARQIGAADMVAAMDQNGVDKAVVFGFPWQQAELFRAHNDYVMEAVSRYPDRLIGFGCFDPAHPEAAAEAQRCLENGLPGIGELAVYRAGLDAMLLDHLAPVMDLCRIRRVPVLIHTNEPVGHSYPGKTPNTLSQIYALVKRFPENRIVLGHWGGGLFFYCLLKKEVIDSLRNVYYDTAASPYLYQPEIYATAVRLAGAEKILLGSDYPLIRPGRYVEEMAAAGLPPAVIDRICGTNARDLLNIGGD
jgi:predicted TIM-barrel fold metal-dependent hydrolase